MQIIYYVCYVKCNGKV